MSDQEITGVSRTYTIENRQGLHLRPASQLVQIFTRCPVCEVFVSVAETRVNGKSIMGLLMLEAGPGTELTVEAAGDGAEEILDRVAIDPCGHGRHHGRPGSRSLLDASRGRPGTVTR